MKAIRKRGGCGGRQCATRRLGSWTKCSGDDVPMGDVILTVGSGNDALLADIRDELDWRMAA